MQISSLGQITTLGASGGLEPNRGTTSYHLPPYTLVDAGTGVQALASEALGLVDNVLLTHAHLDHIATLPLLIDVQFETLSKRECSLNVYALPEVIESLKQHIFNDLIWPDFTQLPCVRHGVLRFVPVIPWEPFMLVHDGATLHVTPFPVSHGVPTCGYCISDGIERVAICGDTGLSNVTTTSLNRLGPLSKLIIECAYSNYLDELAEIGYHLTPRRLGLLLETMDQLPEELSITHLKPDQRERIINELHFLLPSHLSWNIPS